MNLTVECARDYEVASHKRQLGDRTLGSIPQLLFNQVSVPCLDAVFLDKAPDGAALGLIQILPCSFFN